MSKGSRRSLFLFTAAMLLFVAGASAQMDCAECDPYTSHCSDACLQCIIIWDGEGCAGYTETTCGGGPLQGHCLSDECEPDWYEASRVTQGTYGPASSTTCYHHSVQLVTIADANHCNTDSDYWTQQYCDDVIDGTKSGTYPSCCDGYDSNAQPDALFTCDDNHSCTY